MNLKEAKYIIEISTPSPMVKLPVTRAYANGFIEGHDSASAHAQKLVEALEKIKNFAEPSFSGERVWAVGYGSHCNQIAEEALDEWRREIGEEKP